MRDNVTQRHDTLHYVGNPIRVFDSIGSSTNVYIDADSPVYFLQKNRDGTTTEHKLSIRSSGVHSAVIRNLTEYKSEPASDARSASLQEEWERRSDLVDALKHQLYDEYIQEAKLGVEMIMNRAFQTGGKCLPFPSKPVLDMLIPGPSSRMLQILWPGFLAAAKAQRRDAISQFVSNEYQAFYAKYKAEGYPLRRILAKWRKRRKRLLSQPIGICLDDWKQEIQRARLAWSEFRKTLLSNGIRINEYLEEVDDFYSELRLRRAKHDQLLRELRQEASSFRAKSLAELREECAKLEEMKKMDMKALREAFNPQDEYHILYRFRSETKPLHSYLEVRVPFLQQRYPRDSPNYIDMYDEDIVYVPIISYPKSSDAPAVVNPDSHYDPVAVTNQYDLLGDQVINSNPRSLFKGQNALQAVLELKDTPGTIRSIVTFLRFVNFCRKGKLPPAATSIAVAASLYLTWEFGIKPTLRDVQNLWMPLIREGATNLCSLIAVQSRKPLTLDAKRTTVITRRTPFHNHEEGYFDDVMPSGKLSYHYDSADQRWHVTLNKVFWDTLTSYLSSVLSKRNTLREGLLWHVPYEDFISRKVFAEFRPNPNFPLLDVLRHSLRDCPLAKTAWELIPYSFIVDWFLPIGESIQAYDRVIQDTIFPVIREGDGFWYRAVGVEKYGYPALYGSIDFFSPPYEQSLIDSWAYDEKPHWQEDHSYVLDLNCIPTPRSRIYSLDVHCNTRKDVVFARAPTSINPFDSVAASLRQAWEKSYDDLTKPVKCKRRLWARLSSTIALAVSDALGRGPIRRLGGSGSNI